MLDPRLLLGHMCYPLESGIDLSNEGNGEKAFDFGPLVSSHGGVICIHAVFGTAQVNSRVGDKFVPGILNDSKGVHYDAISKSMRYVPQDTVYTQVVANQLKRRAWIVPPHNVQMRLVLVPAEGFESFCVNIRASHAQRTKMKRQLIGWDPMAALPAGDAAFANGVRWTLRFA